MMHRPSKRSLVVISLIFGAVVLTGCLALLHNHGEAGRRGSALQLNDIPFDGRRAYQHLKTLCDIGPRPSGSPGMRQQRDYLVEHFRRVGGQVELQEFDVRHPLDGSRVRMVNLIVRWHPQRRERILLCAHYDTRPFPDEDPRRPQGVFIGANDGASGVAVLAELATHMNSLDGPLGVDFALFDAEEFIFDRRDRDRYFLGSTHFAQLYRSEPPAHRYRAGVLLDMVGDKELHLYQERHSMRWRDTRPITRSIWETAKDLGVREFVARTRHEVRDDHLPLRNIGGIPTCDIIDFDYPRPGAASYWHTEADTADKCSAASLAKVGWVVLEWLKRQQRSAAP